MDFWTIVVLAILLIIVIAYVIALIYEDKEYEKLKNKLGIVMFDNERLNKEIQKIQNYILEIEKSENKKTTKKK